MHGFDFICPIKEVKVSIDIPYFKKLTYGILFSMDISISVPTTIKTYISLY